MVVAKAVGLRAVVVRVEARAVAQAAATAAAAMAVVAMEVAMVAVVMAVAMAANRTRMRAAQASLARLNRHHRRSMPCLHSLQQRQSRLRFRTTTSRRHTRRRRR